MKAASALEKPNFLKGLCGCSSGESDVITEMSPVLTVYRGRWKLGSSTAKKKLGWQELDKTKLVKQNANLKESKKLRRQGGEITPTSSQMMLRVITVATVTHIPQLDTSLLLAYKPLE